MAAETGQNPSPARVEVDGGGAHGHVRVANPGHFGVARGLRLTRAGLRAPRARRMRRFRVGPGRLTRVRCDGARNLDNSLRELRAWGIPHRDFATLQLSVAILLPHQ